MVTTVAALALVGILCVVRRDDVSDALAAVPPWLFVAAVGLHVATLALRSEAWRLALASASGDRLPRAAVHAANAAAFVARSLQSQAALPARVVMLRRVAGSSAPPAGQIWIADVPIVALEICAASLVLVVAAVTGRVPRWIALAAAALATIATAGAVGLGAAVAAGLMLAATSVIAVAGYALLVVLVARVPLALRPGLAR